MMLFDLTQDQRLGSRLATLMEVPLARHEDRPFEEGEFKIRPLDSVRNETVFVCQSLTSEGPHSANDKLMRLVLFIGALRDSGASHVTAVLPYLSFQRKDKRTQPHDPVSTRYLAQVLEAVGLGAIVAIDVHNPAAFDNSFRITKEHVAAAPLFAEHFAPIVAEKQRAVVVSPDIGGVARARALAALLSERSRAAVDVAFVEKHRSGGVVSGDLFAGEVRGAVAIVIDDMICGGTTMARAAGICMRNGAETVHLAATHGLFSRKAEGQLADSGVSSIVVTDTIADAPARCPGLVRKLAVLECADLLGATLRRLTGKAASRGE